MEANNIYFDSQILSETSSFYEYYREKTSEKEETKRMDPSLAKPIIEVRQIILSQKEVNNSVVDSYSNIQPNVRAILVDETNSNFSEEFLHNGE